MAKSQGHFHRSGKIVPRDALTGRVDVKPVGRVTVTRSIGLPNGSRISVVRKDVMDHALGRDHKKAN